MKSIRLCAVLTWLKTSQVLKTCEVCRNLGPTVVKRDERRTDCLRKIAKRRWNDSN